MASLLHRYICLSTAASGQYCCSEKSLGTIAKAGTSCALRRRRQSPAGFARDDSPAAKLQKLEAVRGRRTRMSHCSPICSHCRPRGAVLCPTYARAEEGMDTGGVDPAARGSRAPAAGFSALRGRALDRSDLARIARPHRRAGARSAGAADRDVSPRVPAALDRPAAGNDVGAQSSGPT